MTQEGFFGLEQETFLGKWTQECEDSFNILKHALTSSPILIYPCLEKEFILDTDASGTGTGAVLSQIGDDGSEHVIAYYSKSLSKQQRGILKLDLRSKHVLIY
jgi:hypothetical protein